MGRALNPGEIVERLDKIQNFESNYCDLCSAKKDFFQRS